MTEPKTNKRFIFLGMLPNPVHGLTLINKNMLEILQRELTQLTIFNLLPSFAAHFFPGKRWTLIKSGYFFVVFAKYCVEVWRNQPEAVYHSLSGKLGQLFDVPFIIVARFSGSRLILHHHTFSYLKKTNSLTKWLINQTPMERTHHVVLCREMKASLCHLYKIDNNRCSVLSNSAFLQGHQQRVDRKELLVLGFLSNITFKKGIKDFIQIYEDLITDFPELLAKVAGPFASENEKNFVLKKVEVLEGLEYVGAIYGSEKSKFYDAIDLLVFPSYDNEAEPVTIFEAIQHGVPVIARERGCVKSVIKQIGGYTVIHDHKFVENASGILRKLLQNENNYLELASQTKISYEFWQKQQQKSIAEIINLIQGCEVGS